MQAADEEICPSCGVALRKPSVRCASCGFLLTAAPGPVFRSSLRPRRARPPRTRSRALPLLLAAVAAAIVLATGDFFYLRPRRDVESEVAQANAKADAELLAIQAPALDPNALFAKAKTRALAWHADATLVEIDLGPVVGGGLNPHATLEFYFGKPAGARLGPGTPVARDVLLVSANASGLTARESKRDSAVAVAEPDCVYEDVLEKSAQSGLTSQGQLDLRYAQSPDNDRGLWFVSRDGAVARTLDGKTCTIIVDSKAAPAASP